MHFVLIDDIPAHNDILESKLLELCGRNGWNGDIALKTTNPDEVLAWARNNREPTVYFLDIRLSETQDTLSLFRTIQAQNHESYLVYVSAHTQYAMDCLHTHAFDFLLKPLMDEQLSDCLHAIMRAHQRRSTEVLLQITMGSRTMQVLQSDILCFTRERMNVRMTCLDGTAYVWRESFDHLLPRLNQQHFFQCHRSHIVNLNRIHEIHWGEDKLTLSSGTVIPVSRRRAAMFRAALTALEGNA